MKHHNNISLFLGLFSLLFPFCLFSSSSSKNELKDFTIYLIKQRWHTGIVFQRNEIDTTLWPEIIIFKNYKYIDIGWGDEKFYQHPDFDLALAAEALFIPTPSTLRVFGFNLTIEENINISDRAIEIKITKEQLDSLCKYIHSTYTFNEDGKPIFLSEQFNGSVKFYKANGKYHLFNTCNTWVAKGLKQAGFTNFSSSTILVNELFSQATEIGKELK